MSTEAWKDNGNCKDCRRAKYCRKPCTANRRMAKEKAEQAARCGNAVCPQIPTALVRANLPEFCKEAG